MNYNKIRGETGKETKVLILLGINRAEADSPCVQRIAVFYFDDAAKLLRNPNNKSVNMLEHVF